MTKKIVVCLCTLIIVCSLDAQVSIGLATGANFGTFRQNIEYRDFSIEPDEHDISTVIGLIIGIPVEITISEKLGLFTMLSYYQKGAKAKTLYETPEYIKTEGKTVFGYLEIPVQLKYNFFQKGITVYGLFGPSFGLAVAGKSEFDLWMDFNGETLHSNFTEKYSPSELKDSGLKIFDFSLSLGAGLSHKWGPGNIYFNLNYVYGLSNMIGDVEDLVDMDVKQYNRGLNAVAGYVIPLSDLKW